MDTLQEPVSHRVGTGVGALIGGAAAGAVADILDPAVAGSATS